MIVGSGTFMFLQWSGGPFFMARPPGSGAVMFYLE